MKDWFRRNRWYLVALAVLIPAAVAASLIPRWFPYQDLQPQPEEVALGDTVRYAGADITLESLDVIDGARISAPDGADVVVATLSIDVVEEIPGRCEIVIVSTESGFERQWDPELFTDSDYEVPEKYESLCTFGEEGSYELQMTFLVPAGEVQQPIVEIMSTSDLPRVLRLS